MGCRTTLVGCWGCGRPWTALRWEPLAYAPTGTGFYCEACDVYTMPLRAQDRSGEKRSWADHLPPLLGGDGMCKEAAIVDQDQDQHKAPWDLTDEEVSLLLQAFTQDKGLVLEEDCLTLCAWAQQQKRGALALAGVLAGHLVPVVEGGSVRVTIQARGPSPASVQARTPPRGRVREASHD